MILVGLPACARMIAGRLEHHLRDQPASAWYRAT